jgi:DNA polymerase I
MEICRDVMPAPPVCRAAACGKLRRTGVNLLSRNPKLILLDGNSLANRAFYALPLFTTGEGLYTNAVYGFLTMLFRLLDEEKPDYIAVAFDKSGPTFRHEQYEEYKGTRKGAPDEFRPQLPLLREVLDTLNIPWVQLDRYEADDLIGTFSRQAEEKGLETLIVTGDRDALQLVSDRTTVVMTRKGISETTKYTPAVLKTEYGIDPRQVIDLKALMGDSSDNVPGVPGVGEKTALKLVQEFDTVDNLLEHLDDVKGKLGEKLKEHAGDVLLSRQLVTIDRRAPVETDVDQFRVRDPRYEEALALFRRLEFKSLLPRVAPPEGAAAAPEPAPALTVGELRRAPRAEGEVLAACGPVAAASDDPGGPRPRGLAALHPDGSATWVESEEGALEVLGRPLAGHDIKYLLNWSYRQGREPAAPVFDSALAAYVIDPGRGNYQLADIARAHGLGELPQDDSPEAWAARTAAVQALRPRMEQELTENGLWEVYHEVDLPLIPVLAEMEAHGVAVNLGALGEMSADLDWRIRELTEDIYRLAGYPFNIGSPKQLQELLFEKMGIKPTKKTKTGYSTDAEVLEELAAEHDIVEKILDYRTLTKLKSTYVDALGTLAGRDGRIHTTFNQTVAATGRLSSQDPNLQNIPIRIEEGRRIRKVFVPGRKGWLLLAADYSQIELRIVAHYSGDRSLREAFAQEQDIHTRTASEIFDVPMERVDSAMRRAAKAVNFGLIYGQSDFGLARAVGIARSEAKQFIERYFQLYPGVRAYMDGKIAEAHEKGYVTTLMGRRRMLPEINSRIYTMRQNAERMAINTPIQGTAADLMKVAMLRVRAAMRQAGLEAKMTLQVHDELVFEVPEGEVEALGALVRREMEQAMQLSVPLRVDVKAGPDWYALEKV